MNRAFLKTALLPWKEKKRRKPLLIHGARQVGKTTLLKQFGQTSFQSFHYFNFERNPKLREIFASERRLDPLTIIDELQVLQTTQIRIESDLIIFDEIQAAPTALTSLKYFAEECPTAFIAAAGSLLGLSLSEGASFPVGKVQIEQMFPLTFAEYVEAQNQPNLLTHYHQASPSEIYSSKLSELFFEYLAVGGMPEAVQHFLTYRSTGRTEALRQTREIQLDLIEAHLSDIAKHSGPVNSLHIQFVFSSIPKQLAKTSSKFIFKDVIPGRTGFEKLRQPLDWLERAGLIHKVSLINQAEVPLMAQSIDNSFKLYLFDVGLLGALGDIAIESILQIEKEPLRFKGALYENFVAQELTAAGVRPFSWVNGTAEIEFVIQAGMSIIPIEVKSAINRKAKSLNVFLEKYPKTKKRFFILSPDAHLGKHRAPIWYAAKCLKHPH